MKKILFAVAGILLLVGGGCSNFVAKKATEKVIENASGGKVKIDSNGENFKIKTDEGETQWGLQNKLPDNWPSDAPTYPGATIQFSGSNNSDDGKLSLSLILQSKDSSQAVSDFYKKELVVQGWTIESFNQYGEIATIKAKKDERAFMLSIAVSGGLTSITSVVESK